MVYDSDRDIEETGGLRGMNLANAIIIGRKQKELRKTMERIIEGRSGEVKTKRKRTKSVASYGNFYEAAKGIKTFDIQGMRRVLMSYSRAPVDNMMDNQIIGRFYGTLNTAKERLNID